MKPFIRRLRFGALALLVPFAAFAGHPMMGEVLQRLTQELELSTDQVSQVEAIFNDARTQREAIQSSYTLAQRDQARQEMMAVRESARHQIEAVLTPEQLAEFEELRAERHRRLHEHHGRHGGWPHGGDEAAAEEDDEAI